MDFLRGVLENLLGEVLFLLISALFVTYLWNRLQKWRSLRGRISPDGNRVARERDGEIYISQQPRERNVTNHTASDYGPIWSPDSRWIAFQSNRNGGDYNIWVADVDTGRLIQVTSIPGRERILGWDRDGNLRIDLGGSVLAVKRTELESRLQ